jgi:hypothetical protein
MRPPGANTTGSRSALARPAATFSPVWPRTLNDCKAWAFCGSPDEEFSAATDAHGCVGADAAVVSSAVAASEPAGWRIHRPAEMAAKPSPHGLSDGGLRSERRNPNQALAPSGGGLAAFDARLVVLPQATAGAISTTSNYRKSAGYVYRLPRDPRSWLRRRCGTPGRARTPSPALPQRLRSPAAP